MEKIELWLQNRFIPWSLLIAKYIGILTIIWIISRFLESFLGWDQSFTFTLLLMLSFLIPMKLKENLINRRIDYFLDEELENIKLLVNENNQIDYSILNKTVSLLTRKLSLEDISATEENDQREKIKSAIWKKYESTKSRALVKPQKTAS